MIWILIILSILAIIGIIIVNFPKCAPAGSKCDSSIFGCCSTLECDAVSNMCKVPENTQYDLLPNRTCFYKAPRLTSDPNLAIGLSKEEFAKVVMAKCNDCRTDPSGENCHNVRCQSVMIVDPTVDPVDSWNRGISYVCDPDIPYVEDPAGDVYKLKSI